jgi:diguanylate cyclase (GGDEF)-like protein/PAS domain S-box-containing protein
MSVQNSSSPSNRINLSLRQTLILGAAVGILLPALVLAYLQITSKFENDVELRVRAPMRQYADVLTRGMAVAIWNVDSNMAGELADAVMRNPDVANVAVTNEHREAFVQKQRAALADTKLLREDRDIYYNNARIGRLTVELSVARVQRELWSDLLKQAAALAAQVAISFMFIWLLFDRRMIRPLRELQEGAMRLARGELDEPIVQQRRDEIGRLALGLDAMRTDLAALIEEREQKNAALRIAAIAFESQEGVFVADAEWRILRVNNAFTTITGYPADEAAGHMPQQLLNSGAHDFDLYAAMTESVEESGTWQGEVWSRRKSGEIFPQWLIITAVKDDAGMATHYVGTFSDISARKSAEGEIRSLAFYDPLTSLPNRRLLMDRLQQALAASGRHKRKGALLFVDLDDFKTLNDTLGHYQGDLLLKQVAKRLTGCIREGDTVARLGGDEFVMMLEDLSENEMEAANQAEAVGEKLLATLNQLYQLGSYEHHSTPSIGVTLFGGDQHESIDEPMKRADLAMYQAKAAGRNTLRFFDPQMQAVVTARASLEAGLREAIARKHFILHYQVQVTGDHAYMGAEVLVRWKDPLRGMVSPAEFIPLAEETGLILPLGSWVLETACAQLAIWAGQPDMAHLTIAVNVSARQFRQRDFVDQVLDVIDRTGANPQLLKLELTESLLVANVEDVIAKMNVLKGHGVGFSLDDFGTGYSSLSYLKRLPLFQLKIDQGFVRDILIDANDAAIAQMVIALAKSLGLAVIAEGVETEAQRDFLAGQGCHAYQGYLFGRPLPLEEFEVFVRRA